MHRDLTDRDHGCRLQLEYEYSPKGALTGAALGTGIGIVSGGSFGQVVGEGLIGGAVGDLGGSALDACLIWADAGFERK